MSKEDLARYSTLFLFLLFGRDASVSSRAQGYRIRIHNDGLTALRVRGVGRRSLLGLEEVLLDRRLGNAPRPPNPPFSLPADRQVINIACSPPSRPPSPILRESFPILQPQAHPFGRVAHFADGRLRLFLPRR